MEAQDLVGAEVAAEARDPAERERAAAEREGTVERETPAKEVRMGLPATRRAEALGKQTTSQGSSTSRQYRKESGLCYWHDPW